MAVPARGWKMVPVPIQTGKPQFEHVNILLEMGWNHQHRCGLFEEALQPFSQFENVTLPGTGRKDLKSITAQCMADQKSDINWLHGGQCRHQNSAECWRRSPLVFPRAGRHVGFGSPKKDTAESTNQDVSLQMGRTPESHSQFEPIRTYSDIADISWPSPTICWCSIGFSSFPPSVIHVFLRSPSASGERSKPRPTTARRCYHPPRPELHGSPPRRW